MDDIEAYFPKPSFVEMIRLRVSRKLMKMLIKRMPSTEITARLGFVHAHLREFEEAERCLRAVVQADPKQQAAQFMCGLLLEKFGKDKEAIQFYTKAIALSPGFDDAVARRKNLLEKQKKLDVKGSNKNKKAKPATDEGMKKFLEAVSLHRADKLVEALVSYDHAIALYPSYAEAHNNRGLVLLGLKRFEEALESYHRALEINPQYVEAYCHQGDVLFHLERFDEALASYDQSISLAPVRASLHNNRGAVLLKLKRFEEAVESFDLAIELGHEAAEIHLNRANALMQLNRFSDALADYTIGIKKRPEDAGAYCNLGVAQLELGCFDAAMASYERAIQLQPDLGVAYWNKAVLLLLLGHYQLGWELYEWGLKTDLRRPPHLPEADFEGFWRGEENIEGKKLLIHGEQGFGDVLQFSRYALIMQSKGASVTLAVREPLVGILSTLSDQIEVIDSENELPAFDFQCLMLSLPSILGTTLESIPKNTPYLHPDRSKIDYWQRKLGKRNALRVGLLWFGSASNPRDKIRSLQLDALAPLLEMPFEFHSLQNEVRDSDQPVLEVFRQIQQHQDELKDFTDTAALISELDLVITVDTAVAHLAGALGKPIWILLPFVPDWRWMNDRQDSPWYPSARLFRQAKQGDWKNVISNVRDELQKMVAVEP